MCVCQRLQQRRLSVSTPSSNQMLKVLQMSEVWRRYIHIAVEAQLRDTSTPVVVVVVVRVEVVVGAAVVSELAI